ncbi:MAG: hypothetical protein FWF87_01585 [Synergistaceae bacterium]|nr:hypothetical protein [Synergistaceae bacterium]
MDGRNFYKELMAINVLQEYLKNSGEWRVASGEKRQKRNDVAKMQRCSKKVAL